MKLLIRMLPILILTALVILFFFPLFWPIPQIFIAPDSQLSDVLHFNYPLKFLLSESLKQNKLPLWTDLLGTGFPLIGESQIQAFSIINLVLFKFFPLLTAFNLQYIIIFLGLSIGMYLVSQEIGWSKLTGLYCSIIYAFSGCHIVRIPHLNCLQGMFYVPFILWIILRMQKNKKTKLWLLLPFLFSQQFLQSHLQYVFMTLVFFGLYGYLFWWIPNKKDRPWILKKILIVGSLSLGLAAIQLIPTFEYFLKSNGRADLSSYAIGSLTLKHLLQFFYPYILGDPRFGTYPSSYKVGFHETFSYIGVIPILLALSSIFLIRTKRWIRSIWVLLGILVIFALEKNSPLYFIFSIPPFSWFHVQSRFLAFVTLLLVLLSGYMYEKIANRIYQKNLQKNHKASLNILTLCIFFISVFDVLFFASSYQPILPIQKIEALPEIFKTIPQGSRITSIPYTNTTWFRYVFTNGWKNPEDYVYLLNGGQPNYTAIHGITNLSAYSGFLTEKLHQTLSTALMTSQWDNDAKIATLSAEAINTLRLQNTKYLISTSKLTNAEVKQTAQILSKNSNLGPVFLSELSDIKPRYYLTNKYKQIYFVNEYLDEVKKPNILATTDAFLTTDQTIIPSNDKGTVTVVSDMPTEKIFTLEAPSDMFFVASIFLYPGWKATLDTQKSSLIPANLSGMAVFIPKGTHTLILRFIPQSLYLGISVTVGTILLYCFIIVRFFHRASL